MGRDDFLRLLADQLGTSYQDYKIRIIAENLPNSVNYLVTSSAFANMSRADRAARMLDISKQVFGESFYDGLYVGSALTESEAQKLGLSEHEILSPVISSSSSPAAKPL